MHTLESRFLYSEAALRGAISGQHPICFRILLHPKVRGAVRFLLWWLFLHRRLRARQRGSESFDPERRSTRTVDHLRRALLVFIRVTGKVFRRFPQAFRLRLWRIWVAAFRSFYSRTMRHRIRSTSRCRSKCP